uniref:Uncharacterized protein n=1 Tax=Glossina austeni TaxID=7395 RepID=A0A1A9UGI0_GLOAU
MFGVAANSHKSSAQTAIFLSVVQQQLNEQLSEGCSGCRPVHPERGPYLFYDQSTKMFGKAQRFHILGFLRKHVESGQRYNERMVQLVARNKDDFKLSHRRKLQLAKEENGRLKKETFKNKQQRKHKKKLF